MLTGLFHQLIDSQIAGLPQVSSFSSWCRPSLGLFCHITIRFANFRHLAAGMGKVWGAPLEHRKTLLFAYRSFLNLLELGTGSSRLQPEE